MKKKSLNKKLWFIEYESEYLVGHEYCVLVWAESADEARYLAEDHMEETMLNSIHELEGTGYIITNVEEFNESHKHWEPHKDKELAGLYPVIGTV